MPKHESSLIHGTRNLKKGKKERGSTDEDDALLRLGGALHAAHDLVEEGVVGHILELSGGHGEAAARLSNEKKSWNGNAGGVEWCFGFGRWEWRRRRRRICEQSRERTEESCGVCECWWLSSSGSPHWSIIPPLPHSPSRLTFDFTFPLFLPYFNYFLLVLSPYYFSLCFHPIFFPTFILTFSSTSVLHFSYFHPTIFPTSYFFLSFNSILPSFLLSSYYFSYLHPTFSSTCGLFHLFSYFHPTLILYNSLFPSYFFPTSIFLFLLLPFYSFLDFHPTFIRTFHSTFSSTFSSYFFPFFHSSLSFEWGLVLKHNKNYCASTLNWKNFIEKEEKNCILA